MSEPEFAPLKKALTIATSDSGGGAGIQADLKTFAALGVFGLTCVSGVSAQNTVAVTGLELVSPGLVTAQLKAVFEDIGVDSIKIGLLGGPENTLAVVGYLEALKKRPPVILDPVMVSASGHAFLSPEAVEALKSLMPLATLATPNLPEAAALSGMDLSNPDNKRILAAAEKILALGPESVLIKGGHRPGPEALDMLLERDAPPTWIPGKWIDTPNTHGTGCTLSSAIAAFMAKGMGLIDAVVEAKFFVRESLMDSINLGRGPGPLNHFHRIFTCNGGLKTQND